MNNGLNIFAFWWCSILLPLRCFPDAFLGSEQRVSRRRKGRAHLRYRSSFFCCLSPDNTLSVVYDKAFATKLFEKDVEGMVSLFLTRAGFERRICFASLENEQSDADAEPSLAESAVAQPFLEPQDRLSALLDILNNSIKTIRSGKYQIHV